MSKTQLSVLFKKIQKDDKKEVLEFHVQGDELPNASELVDMAGSITVIEIEKSEAGSITAEFASLQRDSKKTSLKFNIKGDSEIIKLYPFAGRNVTLSLEPSQMSIEEFYDGEEHEGIEYSVNGDGTVDAPQGQVSMDDIPTGEQDDVNFDDKDLLEQ